MPFKKRNYKRRPYRRRHRNKAKLGKPSKGLKQSVYFFKRRTSEVVELNTTTPPESWEVGNQNDLYRQMSYKLSDITSDADFTQLFLHYKLAAVSVRMFFSNTTSAPVGTSVSTPAAFSNSQILVMYAPFLGEVGTTDTEYMLETQSSKRRTALNGGRSIKLYTPLKQLNMVYQSLTNTDYTVQRPRWISTTEPDTPHYGLAMCFQKADKTVFASTSTNYQSVRIETTYYIACKGVH